MTNVRHSVLYTGVTSNLLARVEQHKERARGFTKRYSVDRLVYYELLDQMDDAIMREKQIKGGSRKKKIDSINRFNPKWVDLFLEFTGDSE